MGLIFWNIPTLVFELRHKFLLTNLLINGEKLSQEAISFNRKISDLFIFSFPHLSLTQSVLIFIIVIAVSLFLINKNKSKILQTATVLALLNAVILLIVPISIQGHYIFGLLTIFFILAAIQKPVFRLFILAFFAFFWLKPEIIGSYLAPVYRSVSQTQDCAKLICENEPEPIFVSVQSDLHPYHNGMEFKYLFSEAGCQVKELDTQINEADKMMVVVDNSKYEHGLTAYNELTQFGESEEIKRYQCMENLEVVSIQKIDF